MNAPPLINSDALVALVKQAVAAALDERGLARAPPATTPDTSDWMRPREAARHVRLSEVYLETLRREGGGPRFERNGRRVRYRRDDLDAWLAGRAGKGGRDATST